MASFSTERIAAASRPARARPIDPGEPPRRQSGAIERLADIDVAEPGDDALIEQGGLDRGHLAGEFGSEIGAVEPRLERLRPEAGQQRVPVGLAAPHIIEQAETARVVEADDGAVVEGQDHVVVARLRLAPHRRR